MRRPTSRRARTAPGDHGLADIQCRDALDDLPAVLRFGQHHDPSFEPTPMEVTAGGTGTRNLVRVLEATLKAHDATPNARLAASNG
jgi:hypothetical protein